ncbi:hypothetical protein EI982_08545 [Haloplanus rallus]|uniref:Uncharacterized protein n=1 Tax=Haloplanus rallus TaxID=1816183 RepID=A0A6B9F365_9EURY|nr:hypothetical protein [Haloplanus rallus]QGX94835.1 hypothetical protein EI982_08545 [Haloplanus rallus]
MQTQQPTPAESALTAATTIAGSERDRSKTPPAPCFTIEFNPDEETRRRYRFEPKRDTTGWWRYEDEWTGMDWQCLVRESIKTISLSVDGSPVLDT